MLGVHKWVAVLIDAAFYWVGVVSYEIVVCVISRVVVPVVAACGEIIVPGVMGVVIGMVGMIDEIVVVDFVVMGGVYSDSSVDV